MLVTQIAIHISHNIFFWLKGSGEVEPFIILEFRIPD